MGIIRASALGAADDYPLIGYHNIVTRTGISATSEDASYPATNLANALTYATAGWRSEDDPPSADQYLTITNDAAVAVDYIGIVKHNLGSTGVTASIESWNGSSWDEIVAETVLSDDKLLFFQFPSTTATQLRVRLQPGSAQMKAAAIYCGAILTLEQRVYADHVPATMARVVEVTSMESEAGNFLGRVQTSEHLEPSAKPQLLSPAWVRSDLLAFLETAKTEPFFYAWRPASYPDECAYAWLINDPMPSNVAPANLMSVELKMRAIA